MELSDLRGMGPARLSHLRAMGIDSLRDFVFFFPYKYEDQTTVTPCSQAREGFVMVRGTVGEKPKIAYFRGISRVSARLTDETGSLALCWFNEPWLMAQLPVGTPVTLYGHLNEKKGQRTLTNARIVTKPGWVPVYRAVKGIPARSFRTLMEEALEHAEDLCAETLPLSFLDRHDLIGLREAVRQAHFPESMEKLRRARRRLAFENMLMYMTCVAMGSGEKRPGFAFEGCGEWTGEYWTLPGFPPTGAQRRVLDEIAEDLEKDEAMARLVQGDVGCGKTAIAFGAVYLARKSGFQTAMMAPTEILARQHYENALRMLEPQGISCRLLTGSTRARERREILKALAEGSCDAVFGTHALISEGVEYRNLGLVITDEQHRFGVRQRSSLQDKGRGEDKRVPHVLVMSATPIPRSLALILYGDLKLSLVDELPPGRKPVVTRVVPGEKRSDMYRFMARQVREGRQAYVVCPLVEDSESEEGLRSAKAVYEELKSHELSGLRVGLTWGNQKSGEKAGVLKDFAEGNLDVLVATTVIEVGVNVPNATIMAVENAERYGLSQLHQLRGRVGRGEAESWCFLLSGETARLRVLCETQDGFLVAQKDLELRGPGDLMGTRQSGEALQGFLLDGDTRMLEEVSQAVRELYEDPELATEKRAIEKLARQFAGEKNLRIALN